MSSHYWPVIQHLAFAWNGALQLKQQDGKKNPAHN